MNAARPYLALLSALLLALAGQVQTQVQAQLPVGPGGPIVLCGGQGPVPAPDDTHTPVCPDCVPNVLFTQPETGAFPVRLTVVTAHVVLAQTSRVVIGHRTPAQPRAPPLRQQAIA